MIKYFTYTKTTNIQNMSDTSLSQTKNPVQLWDKSNCKHCIEAYMGGGSATNGYNKRRHAHQHRKNTNGPFCDGWWPACTYSNYTTYTGETYDDQCHDGDVKSKKNVCGRSTRGCCVKLCKKYC